MRLPCRIITSVVIYALVGSTVSTPARLLAECPASIRDDSNPTTYGTYSNCGSPTWELIAYVPYDDEGSEVDTGSGTGQGICYGDYDECNCTYVDAEDTISTETLVPGSPEDNGDGTWDITFSWIFKEYTQLTYGHCTSGACESSGYSSETPVSINYENVNKDTETEDCVD